MPELPRRTSPSLLSKLPRFVAVLAFALLAGGAARAQSTESTSLGDLWAAKNWDAPEPWRTDKWYFQFAYYTWHFHYDPDHQQSYLLDSEYRFDKYWLEGQWIAGFALFQNSFGQFSQYLYGALQWRPIKDHQPFYIKVSAGILHGYVGQYKDKIPLNPHGWAPAIIPSVGYCWVRYCGE